MVVYYNPDMKGGIIVLALVVSSMAAVQLRSGRLSTDKSTAFDFRRGLTSIQSGDNMSQWMFELQNGLGREYLEKEGLVVSHYIPDNVFVAGATTSQARDIYQRVLVFCYFFVVSILA
jgi:hypothetical protein